MSRIGRRQFLAAAGTLAVSTRAVVSQTARVPRVGLLSTWPYWVDAFRVFQQELLALGYIDGRNLEIVLRDAGGKVETLPRAAAGLVGDGVDVIVSGGNAETDAARGATNKIPIIMVVGIDVVGKRYANSLERPGGSITGVTWDSPESAVGIERLRLLKETLPSISRVATLWDPPFDITHRARLDRAASALGLSTFWLRYSGDPERDVAQIVDWGAHALHVIPGTTLPEKMAQLDASAVRVRLPVVHVASVFEGGLLAYGYATMDAIRAAARYVARILQGATPGELPIQRPKTELLVNMDTAKAIGVTIPQPVVQRADRIVDSGAAAGPQRMRRQPRLPRVGYLAPDWSVPDLRTFQQGLLDVGYIDGKNIDLILRGAGGRVQMLPRAATELVREDVDVIVTGTNPVTDAAKAATSTIPIVMTIGTNVIEKGYAKSIARPGRNITGLAWDIGSGVVTRRLQLLKETVPSISRVAFLWDLKTITAAFREPLENAAAALGLSTLWLDSTGEAEKDLAQIRRQSADALYVDGQLMGVRIPFEQQRHLHVLAIELRLPTAHAASVHVERGGLMSYGQNLRAAQRYSAKFVDRILKGAKPGELPIEQPTRFEFAINLQTAKAIGVTIPQAVLVRADRVIE